MQKTDIERDVRTFIVDHFFGGRSEAVTAEGLLLGSVVDSLGLVELVTYLQDRRGRREHRLGKTGVRRTSGYLR
jgi:acyl carrier protein